MAGGRRTGVLWSLLIIAAFALAIGILWYSSRPPRSRTTSTDRPAPLASTEREPTVPAVPTSPADPAARGGEAAGHSVPSGAGERVTSEAAIFPDGSREPDPVDLGVECGRNLKQLGLCVMMYSMDYDEQLPSAAKWCDAIYPYVSGPEFYHCPAADSEYSYGFSSHLDGRRMSEVVVPQETVLLFESSLGEKNATDAGESLCDPVRHPQGNFYVYADGHVKAHARARVFGMGGR